MDPVLSLFTTYLIYPILAFVLIGVAALVGKKNNLLRNKRLIKNNSNILYLQIDIPTALQSKVKIASEILLAVRIKGEANQSPSFPFSMQNSGTRYLGTLANMGTYAPLFGTEQKVKIKIDTLINLKKTSTWQ